MALTCTFQGFFFKFCFIGCVKNSFDI